MNNKKYPCPELIVQTAGLPEEGQDVAVDVPFDAFEIDLEGRFRTPSAVHLSFHVAAVRSDILVSGSLRFSLEGLCDRCAEWSPLSVEAPKLFYRWKNRLGEAIDLTEGVREDIVLALPQSHLCSEDCRGLCPVCGQNLNLGSCSCAQPEATPLETQEDDDRKKAWAALDDLHLPPQKG